MAAALAALSPAAGDDAADTATLLAEEIVLPDGETLTVRAAEPRDALTLDTVMAYGFASDMDAMVSPCIDTGAAPLVSGAVGLTPPRCVFVP